MASKTSFLLLYNQGTMGVNKPFHEFRGEPSKNGHDLLYNHSNWREYVTDKRPRRKMETKVIVWFLLDLLGVTGLGNGIISGVDSAKEAILFILAAAYLFARLIIYVVKNYISIRKELIELREKEKRSK